MTISERADPGAAVSIRRAVRADLLEVFRIEKRSFPQPWPFSAFERYLDVPAFLVAEADASGSPAGTGSATGSRDDDALPGGDAVGPGDVVGYVVGDTVPNHGRPLGHVKDIAVHPARRGDGVGRALLNRALGVLAARGTATVKLEVRPSNDAALSMYREFGFETLKTVPRYYADGEDALVLVLDLERNG